MSATERSRNDRWHPQTLEAISCNDKEVKVNKFTWTKTLSLEEIKEIIAELRKNRPSAKFTVAEIADAMEYLLQFIEWRSGKDAPDDCEGRNYTFKEGYQDGLAGKPCSETNDWDRYRGWLTGNEERRLEW